MREELQTLTGGVAAALTRKEAFLEKPNGDWSDLGPRLCLVASAEKVRDDDDTRACAAMLLIYNSFVASEWMICIAPTNKPKGGRYEEDLGTTLAR